MQQPGGTNDERALVVAAQRGALYACAQLTALHQQDILRLAFLWTGDQPRAVALAEQTFARAMLELPRLDPDAAFRPWLLERLASEATQRQLEIAPGAPAALAAAGGRFQVDDERSRLRIALQRLDAGERIGLLLHDVGGLDLEQLGAALGRRPEALRAQLDPARRRVMLSVDLPDERTLRAALNDAAVDAPRVDLWPELEPEVHRRLASEKVRTRLLTAGAAGAVVLLVAAIGLLVFGGGLRGGNDSRAAAATPSSVAAPTPPASRVSPTPLPSPADVPDRLLLSAPAGPDPSLGLNYALFDPVTGQTVLLEDARYLSISSDGRLLLFSQRASSDVVNVVALDTASGATAWSAPLDGLLASDAPGERLFATAFAAQRLIIATVDDGVLTLFALDLANGAQAATARHELPALPTTRGATLQLSEGRLESTLQVILEPDDGQVLVSEIDIGTLELLRTELLPAGNDGNQSNDVRRLAADALALPPGAAQRMTLAFSNDGIWAYAVSVEQRAVVIVDLARNVVVARYGLDLSALETFTVVAGAPSADGQLTPDGRTLYIPVPQRLAVWEIEVQRWTVRRELTLELDGDIANLALARDGSALFVDITSEQGDLTVGVPLAEGQAQVQPPSGYGIAGSVAELYIAAHGRAPSVAGVVALDQRLFEGIPYATLSVEPASSWPGEEVDVRVTFLAPSHEGPVMPDEPHVRFDPAAGVTVQLTGAGGQQLVVLGREAHGVYSATVRLDLPGIWGATAVVSAAGVEHWTIAQPGVLVVRSGLRGSDGMVYWPTVTSNPDPLRPGSTAMLTLSFVDLINGAPLPTGVTFAAGMPISISLSFMDSTGTVVYETALLRAGPSLYTGLISVPPEGRYQLSVALTYPANVVESIEHGFITVSAAP